jgi:hypothetical protein
MTRPGSLVEQFFDFQGVTCGGYFPFRTNSRYEHVYCEERSKLLGQRQVTGVLRGPASEWGRKD